MTNNTYLTVSGGSLRKVMFDIDFADSGAKGLKLLSENEYSVVVSDMQMPEMNGAEFLKNVKDKSPDTVRIMLTGNADQQTAVTAINDSDVFRFLNKPCVASELALVLDQASLQYRNAQN